MKKPFIKLLRSPNADYFYDVNKNEIIGISETVYNYLENGVETAGIVEEIESLKNQGYLSNHKIKVIEHSSTSLVKLLYRT